VVKKEGMVTVNWLPVAKIFVAADGDTEIRWCGETRERLGISKDKVLEHFAASSKGRAASSSVQWCL
jgi:hypothetical protein